jgi:hypothetical protein
MNAVEFEQNDNIYTFKGTIHSIAEYIQCVEEFKKCLDPKEKMKLYFRGESKDYGNSALCPSVYRNKKLLENEHKFYREMQRFNNLSFEADKATIDYLCRMQHFSCPTRLLDLSEDALTALYFAVSGKQENDAVAYIFVVPEDKIKYYDSDTVSIIANLAKLPLDRKTELWKETIKFMRAFCPMNKTNEKYNLACGTLDYLLHEVQSDKSYFGKKFIPQDLFSVQCVKTKLANERIRNQKGAFLLFGLNIDDVNAHIPLLGGYKKPGYWKMEWKMPADKIKILKIKIGGCVKMENLENIGFSTPYIYSGMDKVSEYLKTHLQ